MPRRNRHCRRRVRGAVTLIEMLVLIVLLVVITDFTVRMIRMFAGDIPRAYRDLQTNVTVQDMLRQLRRDIEGCRDIRRMPSEAEKTRPVLAVTLPEGVVFYEFGCGEVRRGATAGGDPNDMPSHVWPIPHAVFEWEVTGGDDQACALEITAAIERVILARPERKLRNSHVFFVGSGGKVE